MTECPKCKASIQDGFVVCPYCRQELKSPHGAGELSPEERERIYAEEKARYEARVRIEAEAEENARHEAEEKAREEEKRQAEAKALREHEEIARKDSTKLSFGFFAAIGVVVLSLVLYLWVAFVLPDKTDRPVELSDEQAATVTPSSDAPKETYISSALGYLKSLNTYDTEVAMAMAGTATGKYALGDVKAAIERAKFIEDAAWSGDYQKNPPVSSEDLVIHKKVTECRRLHDSALKEMLAFWKDGNEAHIESGAQTFQRAVLLTNECNSDVGKILKAMLDADKSNK